MPFIPPRLPEALFFILILFFLFVFQFFFLRFSRSFQNLNEKAFVKLINSLGNNNLLLMASSLGISFFTQSSSAVNAMSLALSRSGLLSFKQTVNLLLCSYFGPLITLFIILSILLSSQVYLFFLLPIIFVSFILLRFNLNQELSKALIYFSALTIISHMAVTALQHPSWNLYFLEGSFITDHLYNLSSHKIPLFLTCILVYFLTGASFACLSFLVFLDLKMGTHFSLVGFTGLLFAGSLWGLFEIRKGALQAKRAVCFLLLVHCIGLFCLSYLWSYLPLTFFEEAYSYVTFHLFYVFFLICIGLFFLYLAGFLGLFSKTLKKRAQKLKAPLLSNHFSSVWALEQIHQEVKRASVNISNFLNFNFSALREDNLDEIINKLKKYERIMNSVKSEFSSFISKVSTCSLSKKQGKKLRGLILTVENLESLSDHCLEFFHSYSDLKYMNVSIDKKMEISLEQTLKKVISYYESVFIVLSEQGKPPQGERGRREQQFLSQSEDFRKQLFDFLYEKNLSKETAFLLQKMILNLELIQKVSKKLLKNYAVYF